jgi:hypothetical protein
MTLSEEQKHKIQEEEEKKLEEEKYRERVKKNLNKKPTSRLTWLVLIFIVISVAFAGIMNSSSNKSSQENATSTKTTITQQDKDTVAKMFCDNRSDGKPYYDLQWFADSIAGKTIGDHPNYVTKKPLLENCKKIAEFSLKAWGKEQAKNIASKKIWIGMNSLQLIYSWGIPRDMNDTTTSYGIHSQWIYGTFKPYVYLEGKDKESLIVTSWQD